MNFQRLIEGFAHSEFAKVAAGTAAGSSAALLISFQQMKSEIHLSTLETNKKIEALEQKMRSDEIVIRQYLHCG